MNVLEFKLSTRNFGVAHLSMCGETVCGTPSIAYLNGGETIEINGGNPEWIHHWVSQHGKPCMKCVHRAADMFVATKPFKTTDDEWYYYGCVITKNRDNRLPPYTVEQDSDGGKTFPAFSRGNAFAIAKTNPVWRPSDGPICERYSR